jgi:hypothetical protein
MPCDSFASGDQQVQYMALDPDLDYAFGWRWLLPIAEGDSVWLSGFTDPEVAFWRQVLPDGAISPVARSASCWLVKERAPIVENRNDIAQLRTLCFVGSGSIAARWARWSAEHLPLVREYALLPPANPRVVVTLGKTKWVVCGLDLHRPGRLFARLVVAILKRLVLVGVDWPLRRRMVLIATDSTGWVPQGARLAGIDMVLPSAPNAFALYLGLAKDDRKTVILPLGEGQNTLFKQGASSLAKAALRNEAAALRVLQQTPLAAQVPSLVGLTETDGLASLEQEYRRRRPASIESTTAAAADFLSTLSTIDRTALPLAVVLNGLKSDKHIDRLLCLKSAAALLTSLETLATDRGVTVLGNRSHGDFAPWNCAWSEQGFFVYDWEESRPWDTALGDAFYYAVATALHVEQNPNPAHVESRAFAFVKKVMAGRDFLISDTRMYWSLWLLDRYIVHPAALYEQLIDRVAASWARPSD